MSEQDKLLRLLVDGILAIADRNGLNKKYQLDLFRAAIKAQIITSETHPELARWET